MSDQKVEKKDPSVNGKMRILVIDDEPGMRQMLQYELTAHGHQVEMASDGAEALEKIKQAHFDLAISDIKMPNLDGIQFLKKIKEVKPQIEVIMSTGFATINVAVQCIKEGAYDFITKPYNMAELRTRIDKLIQKKELYRQVDTLTELNRLKSEFLSNTSHELRTPMSAIIGYSQLFLDRIYGDMTEQQMTGMSRISANAKRLLHMINNILDVSRMSAGRMPLYLETFNLRELIVEVKEMMEVLAEERGLTLEFISGDDLKVSSDKTRVKQILINLIGNAIKFTSRGGIFLSYTVDHQNSQVHIVVKDTGIGIKTEHLKDIFDDFVQGDSSTTREYGGTGLGLSIVKKIMALLGGKVGVKSVEGEGAEFSVTLPIQTEPEEKEAAILDRPQSKEDVEPKKEKDGTTLLAIKEGRDSVNYLH